MIVPAWEITIETNPHEKRFNIGHGKNQNNPVTHTRREKFARWLNFSSVFNDNVIVSIPSSAHTKVEQKIRESTHRRDGGNDYG